MSPVNEGMYDENICFKGHTRDLPGTDVWGKRGEFELLAFFMWHPHA